MKRFSFTPKELVHPVRKPFSDQAKGRSSLTGFTLIEISIATLVFIVTLTAILLFYISSTQLTEISFNTTKALFAAKTKLEEIRNYNFSKIYNDFSNYKFIPKGFGENEAKGVVYVNKEDAREDLLRVNVAVCFKAGVRIIGEDSNLDGILDTGEDENSNNFLDSPVELTTLLTSR
ncbi:MAG: hypothetical protein KKC11_08920 [Candidatus Omnitrophica bacterium]|nr:hypothetical protein [Candidatus Omnitrophota bacterium]MBU0896577.1 hypothetical protein [Candidatus Omnitrophota bacterium]MBU1133922.1 hypothetical protein [Candidatus Omnitrophota bacterium]MBU1366433.1 hypothetical protein [Candidatus Omnitrophota bacterium]MBU1523912.1 hypothetical protein [Candidatus Omnitrophota bacterium]